MIGNCKDCKHWNSPETTSLGFPGTDYGECEAILTYQNDINKNVALALAIGYDDSGTVMCKAAFGCILFAEKDAV